MYNHKIIKLQFLFFLLILVISSLSSANAQNWNLSFSYANTQPEIGTTFHGVDLGFERIFLNRLSIGIQTTILVPKNVEVYSYPVYSNTDQKVSTSNGFIAYDVLHLVGVHLYLKYGYGRYEHSYEGFKRTFIDFPTDGPNPATDTIDRVDRNHGSIFGYGIEIPSVGNFFLEASIFSSSFVYTRIHTGFKISF